MEKIVWEVKTGVFSNSLLWLQLVFVSFVGSAFVGILLISLNLFENHWEEIPQSVLIWLCLAGGMFIFFALVFILVSKGITTRYTVSEEGVMQETLTTYGKFMKVFAFLGLLFGGKQGLTAAGSTLLASSREVIFSKWNEISHIKFFPKKKEIRLKNSYRTLIQLICNEENYNEILKIIENNVKFNENLEEIESIFPKIINSILSILFGILLLPRMPIHFVGIFTIIMVTFSLFAIWNKGKLKKLSNILILLILIIGISLAFYYGETNFSKNGTAYALFIEIASFLYFANLSIISIFKK